MLRLFDGVYTWTAFNAEKQFNFNGFVFSGPGGCVVVDPPPLSDDDKAYLERAGVKPGLIVITNRNHLRDWRWWAERFDIPLALHEAEVDQVDVKVARRLTDGEALAPGLRVVHLPGKSPGEIGLYWEERKLLMLGDALIAPLGSLRMLPEAKLDDPLKLRKSLRKRLPELEFEVLLVGDGDPILSGAKAAVGSFLPAL